MRYTISKQIMVCMVAVVIAFTLMNVYTFVEVKELEKGYEGLVKRSAPLVFEVKDVSSELFVQDLKAQGYVYSGDAKYISEFEQSDAKMDKMFDVLGEKLITAEGKQQLAGLKEAVDEYHTAAKNIMQTRQQSGEAEAAKLIEVTSQKMLAAHAKMEEYEKFLTDRMDLRVDQNKERVALMYTTILVVDIALLLFSIGMAFYLSRKISRPLRGLVNCASSIARGDLKTEIIKYHGNDEVGDLVAAFSQMTEELKHLIVEVSQAAEQVASSSNQLSASAEQSAQASGQVAQTITEVAAGAATQAEGIERTGHVVKQMAAAIDHIAQNAGHVSEKSADTTKAAEMGKNAVDQADSQMTAINNAVSDSAKVIDKLGQSSVQIGQIVDVITGIAGQTNLLALNAAIEAARAGEAGRGFAVVAEEVRKLAEQSETAAKQISELIRDIQSETENAVNVMKQGTAEVEKGTEVIKSTGDRFENIVDLIEGLNAQIQEISAASEQLAASSEEVVGSVREVKKVAGKTASNTQTISAAAEEQSAAMEEIASSSQALSALAMKLQNAVMQFKM